MNIKEVVYSLGRGVAYIGALGAGALLSLALSAPRYESRSTPQVENIPITSSTVAAPGSDGYVRRSELEAALAPVHSTMGLVRSDVAGVAAAQSQTTTRVERGERRTGELIEMVGEIYDTLDGLNREKK